MRGFQTLKVRLAEYQDVPALIRLGRDFYFQSPYADKIDLDLITWKDVLEGFIGNPDAILMIGEKDGVVVGFCIGTISPCYFNRNEIVSQEMIWYVDPEARGCGAPIFKAFEAEAKKRGASVNLCTSTPNLREDAVGAFYNRAGYMDAGKQYLKRIA